MSLLRIFVHFWVTLGILGGASTIFQCTGTVCPLIRRRDQKEAQFNANGPTHVLNFTGLVEKHGYVAEEHRIVTADGYKLRIHRIPGTPTSPKQLGKSVVFLQHGLFDSSDSFVLLGPGKDLAFILADNEYDVWIGNVRGNFYSRAHESLSPDTDPEFWSFSFHEIALHDISAVIDHILAETGERSLIYIGHSMGTTISYVLLSSRPEYNDKIRLVVSLSPVAFWRRRVPPFVKFLSNNVKTLLNLFERNRVYEIFPRTPANAKLAYQLCRDGSPFQHVCISLIFEIVGSNYFQLNSTILPSIFSHYPSGTSVHTLNHFYQTIVTGDFRPFDYGIIRNFATYNQMTPPSYNLTKITTPVALIYGVGDALALKENLIDLQERLPNLMAVESVPDYKFSHWDFLFARDAKSLLYNRVLEMLSKVSNQRVPFYNFTITNAVRRSPSYSY